MKILTGAGVLFLCLGAHGQSFVATPAGLRDSSDLQKSFLVLKIEGASAKDLYDKALAHVVKTYENPDKVVKGKIEGGYLRFRTYAPAMTSLKNGYIRLAVDAEYAIELSFKEGKIKYEVISLEMHPEGTKIPVIFSGGLSFSAYPIFNKEGELKQPETKAGMERHFNGQVTSLLAALRNEKAGDW